VGRSLAERGDDLGVEVLAVRRPRKGVLRQRDVVLEPSDRLLVRGGHEEILALVDAEHLTLVTTARPIDAPEDEPQALNLAEMMVGTRSRYRGRLLGGVRRQLPGDVTVLGLERHGTTLGGPLGDVRLEAGDILLVRAPPDRLVPLHREGDLALLGVVQAQTRRTGRMGLAVGIVAGVVLLAAFGVLPILTAALLGMTAMLLTGCVRPQEVYEELDWGVVILLGSLLGLGRALQTTGAAALIATEGLELVRPLGPLGVLALVYVFTSLLTELITNNAAALVLAPVSIELASGLGVSPLPYLVAVMFAASNSFATPIGYQTNTFIYSPGGYRFTDFTRVGGPLVLLLAIVATLVLPVFFPF
jgi:di/tricarboxylate transporter